MNQYQITLTGVTPLLMHDDNLKMQEKVKKWQLDPANKEMNAKGDDRSPAWTWMGYTYHDGRIIGIPSDNLMTLLREGGSKISTGKGTETYKKHTQAGVLIDTAQWPVLVSGGEIDFASIWDKLMGENDFNTHIDTVEDHNFELLIKNVRVGASRHVRVRPMFREWKAAGTLTVIDEETTGLKQEMLQRIFDVAGSMCGLGDWRPSSPSKSGTFGKFTTEIEPIG